MAKKCWKLLLQSFVVFVRIFVSLCFVDISEAKKFLATLFDSFFTYVSTIHANKLICVCFCSFNCVAKVKLENFVKSHVTIYGISGNIIVDHHKRIPVLWPTDSRS